MKKLKKVFMMLQLLKGKSITAIAKDFLCSQPSVIYGENALKRRLKK
jgi:hypothetical protein